MTLDPRTPVLVGGGQVSNRVDRGDDPMSPTDLMTEALRGAFSGRKADALRPQIDSIRVARSLSWRYRDPGALVAESLGCTPKQSVHAAAGGQTPQALVSQAAADLAAGRCDVVAVCGAESWRTRMAFHREGNKPDWESQGDDVPQAEPFLAEMEMSHPHEKAAGLVMPVQIYPLFDTAHRAELGRPLDEHVAAVSELWAGFAAVAAKNNHAWDQRGHTAEEIRTVTPDNRMIGLPYPKLMNSNNMVEQGAGVVLCTVERAEAAGVPRDEWVFLHAASDAAEPFMSERRSLARSPAAKAAGERVLELAGSTPGQIEHLDLYSCFPAAVQIGAKELGISLDRQLTVTGGLGFAGGPWNNYVSHAIATMYTVLRDDPGTLGLVWGNGGALTKHAMAVYGTEPPANGFRMESAQPAMAEVPQRTPDDSHVGNVEIESYTVMFDRAGQPEQAFVAGLPDDERRTWMTSDDTGLCRALIDTDPLGQTATRSGDGAFSL